MKARRRHKSPHRVAREPMPEPAQFYAVEVAGYRERRGDWASGLCPFHDDHHPSLQMNLQSGGYVCLACQARGGSIVSFVSNRDGLSYREAADWIRSRHG